MAKRRGRLDQWLRSQGGLPDLDLEIDHDHDHDLSSRGDGDFGSARDRARQLQADTDRDRVFDHERDLDRNFQEEFERDLSREHDLRPKLSPEQSPELDDEAQFQRDLRLVTPRVIVSYLLIGANVGVFALLVLMYHVPLMTPRAQDLLPWGANFSPYTTGGEWWRLFTCMFLHFGLLHIGFNMWILKEVGPLVERLVGNIGFLILYLGSGLVASMASTWWNPQAVSAGASGAIFGVIGALLGVLMLGHGTIPKESLSRMRKAVTTFVIYNIYIGLNTPGIDMAAHLGGLGVGVLCGMVMTRSNMLDTAEGRDGRNLTAGAICALCMLWMLVVIPDSAGNATKTLLEFVEVRDRTGQAYEEALSEMELRRIDDETFANTVDGLLPDMRRLQHELAGLQGVERVEGVEDQQQADVQLAEQFLSVRIAGWEALVNGLRTGDEAMFAVWQDKEREAGLLAQQLR